jgi:hypothetical protein
MGGQPKVSVPPTTSKGAEGVLSASDAAYLAERWGIKAGAGARITKLPSEVLDDLLRARASRHTTHYGNARSDAAYRRRTEEP